MTIIKPAEVKSGMYIKVHQRIKEGEKERVQAFEGIVIKRRGGNSSGANFTVRKKSGTVFVEKIFPVHLPTIEKIEFLKQLPVRRAQITYIRNLKYKPKKKAHAIVEMITAKEIPSTEKTT